MKLRLPIVFTWLLLLMELAAAPAAFAQKAPSFQRLEQICLREQNANQPLLQKRAKASSTYRYDVRYHRLHWWLTPDTGLISGSVFTRFRTTQPTDSIRFDLAGNMAVDSVTHHGSQRPFAHVGSQLAIALADTLPRGTIDSVTVFYRGKPNQNTGFGAFRTGKHDSVPILWTLSEPYGAHEWWPCKQSLTDKVDSLDVFIHTPPGQRAASNGVLIKRQETVKDEMIYHWRHGHPIATYLVAVAVTNYATYTDYFVKNGDSLPILNYVYPSDSAEVRQQTRSILPIFGVFDSLFGAYPFADEKYGHAQFETGGAMEHQTMSFMGSFGHELMAHELAHQWFGNKITCGSWQDIWLNEGFATYLTGLTYENMFPDQNWWQKWKELNINRVLEKPGGSVYVQDTSSVGRVFDSRLSYSKGALVLHMLRFKVGDEAFFKAIRNYLNDTAIAYGYATTGDLIRHFEEASGQKLAPFFQQWIYGEGYPIYDVRWNQYSDYQLEFNITQSTSHSSVPFFDIPIPLLVQNSTQDTLIKLQPTKNEERFLVTIGFPADSVQFDPHHWLVAKATIEKRQHFDQNEAHIDLFPNPVADELVMEASSNLFKINEVAIYDRSGRVVSVFSVVPQPSLRYVFSIDHLPAGVYFLEARTNDKIMRKRFLKVK